MMPGDKPLPNRTVVIFVCCFMVSLNVHHVIGGSVLADDQTPGHQTLSHITDTWRQSTHDSNIQSKHDSNIQSTHDFNIQSTHDSNIQSTHDSNIQSTHDSNIQSTLDFNIQSTHDSNIQSTHDSNIQSTHDSNIQSTHDSNIQSPDVMASPSPCDVFKDKDELIVNCQGRSLTNVSSLWFPENTTSILLDNNMLTSVPANLNQLRLLRRLYLSNNRIEKLNESGFGGLEGLQDLRLDCNGLDMSGLSNDTFSALKQLTVLYLQQDKEFVDFENFGYDFLFELRNLESLAINSAGENVYFNINFNKLEKLATLDVRGEARKITNLSFENLSQLRSLTLRNFNTLQHFNSSALRPLTNLQNFYIDSMQARLHHVLNAFQYFVNRSMDNIFLENIWQTLFESYSNLLTGDGILTPNSTRYLRQICVSHLVFRRCRISIIFNDAMASATWDRCLKIIDFTDNQIIGLLSVAFQVANMKSLEKIVIRDSLESCNSAYLPELKPSSVNSSIPLGYNILQDNDPELITEEREAGSNPSNSITKFFSVAKQDPSVTNASKNKVETLNTSSNHVIVHYKAEQLLQKEKELFVYVSKSIRYITVARLFWQFPFRLKVTLIGAENCEHLDVSDGGMKEFTGRIKGLTGLKKFSLSGNDLSQLNPQFFDTMPSLLALSLAGCNLNIDYMSSSSERLFLNLQYLQQLDLSFNSLTSLSSRTFSSNPNLFEIRLSRNRFRAIPFDLINTPRLQLLDVSFNALISISAKDRRELDALAAGNGGLRLFLEGNVLSCGCVDIQFLHWLQMTTVELDMARNYSCIDNDGVLTNTAVLSDLEAYWRQCFGKMFLSYSLTLFCLLIIGFLLCSFVTKYKTYIISGLLNLFSETFLKKPSNYEIGVFIGYADRDYQFACHDLRQFIEDTLGLTTFIIDRDLSPSTDLASGIIDAINRSWRVLLVVNETFLSKDDWFLYTCRSAISNLTPANPNLIVIMVDSQLRHRLPRDILGAVSEENIIVMNEGRRLKYDVTEKLRTRLLA